MNKNDFTVFVKQVSMLEKEHHCFTAQSTCHIDTCDLYFLASYYMTTKTVFFNLDFNENLQYTFSVQKQLHN